MFRRVCVWNPIIYRDWTIKCPGLIASFVTATLVSGSGLHMIWTGNCTVSYSIPSFIQTELQIDELMQERRKYSVLAMELRLSCTNPSKCGSVKWILGLRHGHDGWLIPSHSFIWRDYFTCPSSMWGLANCRKTSLIARFMGPTWGPSGSDTDGPHVGPMNLAIWVG